MADLHEREADHLLVDRGVIEIWDLHELWSQNDQGDGAGADD
jgi:hypothetical protein